MTHSLFMTNGLSINHFWLSLMIMKWLLLLLVSICWLYTTPLVLIRNHSFCFIFLSFKITALFSWTFFLELLRMNLIWGKVPVINWFLDHYIFKLRLRRGIVLLILFNLFMFILPLNICYFIYLMFIMFWINIVMNMILRLFFMFWKWIYILILSSWKRLILFCWEVQGFLSTRLHFYNTFSFFSGKLNRVLLINFVDVNFFRVIIRRVFFIWLVLRF